MNYRPVLHHANLVKNLCFVCWDLVDCCAAAPAHSTSLDLFDATFSEIATSLGVKLAPRNDPDKSFSPSTSGLVLGIRYNTVSWTWSLGQEKLIRLLHDLKNLITCEFCYHVQIWSIVGKLLHIRPLIPNGKFNFHHLLKANSFSNNKNNVLVLTSKCKQQQFFWFTMIRLCPHNTSIPNPDFRLPPWAINAYCDAAGGSPFKIGLGVGAELIPPIGNSAELCLL